MYKFFVLFFAVLATSSALHQYEPIVALFRNGAIPSIPSLHGGIKETLDLFDEYFKNYSLELPDEKRKIGDVTFKLTNGKISGIGSIYRDSDASFKVYEDLVYLQTQYAFENITINCDFEVIYKDEHFYGQIVAEDTGCTYISVFSIDRQHSNVSMIDYIVIENDIPLNIKLKGNSNEDLQITEKTNIYHRFEKRFKDIIQDQVKQVLLDFQDDFNFNLA